MSVVTAHLVYFYAFTITLKYFKNARKSGVGCRQFEAGVNGLKKKTASFVDYVQDCKSDIFAVTEPGSLRMMP